MKLRYSLTMMALCICATGFARQTRINLYGAYVFDDKFGYDTYYEGKVKGGFQYGAGIELIPHLSGIELLYIGQSTTAPTEYYDNGKQNTDFKVGLNYVMLAGTKYFGNSGKVEGYGGGMLGANFISIKNPDNGNSNSKTKFAWGLRLGGNIWVSEKVGIKLQAMLLSSVQSAGGGLYFGTGGVSTGLTTYSSMFQFSLGGGLAFRVGH